MGDRVNIAVQDGGKRVYLYGHWSGHDAPDIVRRALAKRERWNDPPYLTRIVFCEMVKKNVDGTTDYGISPEPSDNEYPFLVVDCDTQTVRLEGDTREGFGHCKPRGEAKSYPFAEYADLPKATWATLDTGRFSSG